MIVPVFTFHYGPIQIFLVSECALDLSNLHSTMVLFKCGNWMSKYTPKSIYIPLWSYSNLSKRFNRRILDFYLHSTMVLFKSKGLDNVKNGISIYIPLWSYSNFLAPKSSVADILNLHSTMVLFK